MFETEDIGKIFTWTEVNRVHRVRIGIYQRNGRLISLLTDFGKINPCYPDTHGETSETILYTGNGRHGDQNLDPQNRALLNSIETGHTVPLFNKLSTGRWEFLGYWQVTEANYVFDQRAERMVWQFKLRREIYEKKF